ncbi:MAG: OadG family protein [Bacteroidales bacterium]|jgi:Na+-transporting methylmalonyl-CoA/oxaloacetate decarboxylase gamma subunit|nr:OadG family protein [Bacteroidales bacterium]
MNSDLPDVAIRDGLIISFVGIIIVFTALFILYKMFQWLSMLLSMNTRQKLRRQGKLAAGDSSDLEIPADHSAAIAMALFLCNELHDEESNVLTIERVSRLYSPWSSKYYNMRKRIR